MWIKRSDRIQLSGDDIPRSEITPRRIFENRRRVLQAAGAAAMGGLIGVSGEALAAFAAPDSKAQKLKATTNAKFVVPDKVTPFKDVTTYNNFYEFGTDKGDPAENAHTLRPRPWLLTILAISLGAPFWFDALSRMARLRSSGNPEPAGTTRESAA